MTGERPRVAVVGAGVTGLTVAFELLSALPGAEVTVLEAAPVAGGKIARHRADGYTVELGPNGFLDNGADTRTLADALGLGPRLRPAADAARERFLLRGGRLLPLPLGSASFAASPLLSPAAKARVLAEPLVRRAAGEETVHAFLTRRFGPRAAALLAAPLVHGVTSGDPWTTSLDAAFPRIRALERDRGSLLLAALRGRLLRAAGRAGPPPRLTGFADGGMRVLVDALTRRLGERLRTGRAVTALRRAPGPGGGWLVETAGHEPVRAGHVVVTVPAPAAARLLTPHLPRAAATLAGVRYAPVRVVSVGYQRRDLAVLPRGFGYLTVPPEPTRILGVVHASVVFPDCAPPDGVLLRAFAGGAEDPGFAELDPDEAVAAVHRDVTTLFGPAAEPEFRHDHVWPEAIPQYAPGHGARVRALLDAVAGVPGLHLAGSAYHGVAVNECVRDARRAASEVLTALRGAPSAAPAGEPSRPPRAAGRCRRTVRAPRLAGRIRVSSGRPAGAGRVPRDGDGTGHGPGTAAGRRTPRRPDPTGRTPGLTPRSAGRARSRTGRPAVRAVVSARRPAGRTAVPGRRPAGRRPAPAPRPPPPPPPTRGEAA
ncbi:protoporphyrinogen oxidase [Streptomyces mobaraensis]|uniref:protoporphyrinogen oxidase n=1 Tax=Streptomyces mobaraensis TaxID=35621 RepID=UPI001CCADF52|nr:protoporphyrinogen oxidase [Streptomyces mobaraensis]UBI35731.1 protoporphyrinogen oxidase [Streptomyces mobaraensis]